MHNVGRSERARWGLWLLILVAVLVLTGVIALTVYGGTVRPRQHEVEQVISNDRFPN